MSKLRYRALKALGDYLETEIPALAGKVKILRSEAETWADYPGLAIVPRGPFTFEPHQADEVYQEDDPASGPPTSTLLEDVGCFSGGVELRLTTINAPNREELEELIVHALIQRENTPGVTVVDLTAIEVGGVATLYAAPCTFTLDTAEWRDEMVLEKRRFTWLELEMFHPALVQRSLSSINELYLAITADLTSTDPVVDEIVLVAEDGSLSGGS